VLGRWLDVVVVRRRLPTWFAAHRAALLPADDTSWRWTFGALLRGGTALDPAWEPEVARAVAMLRPDDAWLSRGAVRHAVRRVLVLGRSPRPGGLADSVFDRAERGSAAEVLWNAASELPKQEPTPDQLRAWRRLWDRLLAPEHARLSVSALALVLLDNRLPMDWRAGALGRETTMMPLCVVRHCTPCSAESPAFDHQTGPAARRPVPPETPRDTPHTLASSRPHSDSLCPEVPLRLAWPLLLLACADPPPPGSGRAPSAAVEPTAEAPEWPLAAAPSDPPNAVLHQLDPDAWDRSLDDLLVPGDWAAGLSTSTRGDGFSNAAAVQQLSSGQLEAMLDAATEAATQALADPVAWRVDPAEARWRDAPDGVLGADSVASTTLWAPAPGRYRVELDAVPSAAAELSFSTAEADVRLILGDDRGPPDVKPADSESHVFSHEAILERGRVQLRVEHRTPVGDLAQQTLTLDEVRLRGPLDPEPEWSDARRCSGADGAEGRACARETLSHLAQRAWRRPVTDAELDALLGVYSEGRSAGDSWLDATAAAVSAVLGAPDFLYRLEPRVPLEDARRVPLGPHAVAARLAHALWASVPDEPLWESAASGALLTPEGLSAQVDRMLDDSRSEVLVERLWLEWLAADRVDSVERLPPYADALDTPLKEAAAAELRRFGQEMLFGDRPVSALMTLDTLWVNDRLADHYGVELPGVDGLVPVSADSASGPSRAGLLGRAGLYLALSGPDDTRPTHRGLTLMTRLLCIEAPPPPDADVVQAGLEAEEGLTPQEVMARHAADPVCAACHTLMDPLGYALEGYDPNGAYRTHYANGLEVPSGGTLHTGARFADVPELSRLLADDPALHRCATQHIATWLLGRAPSLGDLAVLDDMEAQTAGGTLRDTIHAVVASEAFLTQRTLDPEER
jgi:hypothetical protein